MEEINVGEFIRTELGQIARVDEDLKEFIDEHRSTSERDIVEFLGKIKNSKSIIDLIEVGDYVNGYRVYHIAGHYVSVESFEKYDLCFEEQDIKTIVTHEQMSNIEYRLEN